MLDLFFYCFEFFNFFEFVSFWNCVREIIKEIVIKIVRMMKIVIWRSRDHVTYTEYLKSDEGTVIVEYLP